MIFTWRNTLVFYIVTGRYHGYVRTQPTKTPRRSSFTAFRENATCSGCLPPTPLGSDAVPPTYDTPELNLAQTPRGP